MELDPSRADKEAVLHEAARQILDWLDDVPAGPVVPAGAAEASQLRWEPPAKGRPVPEAIRDILANVVPRSFNVLHPGFMAYVPNTGLWVTAVADLMADALDRYPTVRAAGAGPARVEDEVLRWFCEWIGYPAGAGGVLTSGGSMANLSAFVTARVANGEGDLRRLRWYCSDQTHHSNHKAARIAGLSDHACVVIPSDRSGRIDLVALQAAIASDVAAGHAPFLILANAGTTDTGAVDDMTALAKIAHDQRVWLHGDAAYGGFFVLTPQGKQTLQGLEACDSVTLDPHKGLGLPFGTGALVVRDMSALHDAHAYRGPYMPDSGDSHDACDLGPELSRSWRGLRVWLPVMIHGLDALREHLERSLSMAQETARRLAAIDGIVVRETPALSAFAFRRDGEDLEALNARLLEAINQGGKVFLSATRLSDGPWLRVCILNAKTGPEQLDALVDAVEDAVAS